MSTKVIKTWIDRLPQPDRSGVIGAVMMVNFWLLILVPYTGSSELICTVFPWKCQEQVRKESNITFRLRRPVLLGYERARKPHYLSSIFLGKPQPTGNPKGNSICACHYDIRMKSDGDKVHHIGTGSTPEACASEFPFQWATIPNEWYQVGDSQLCWRRSMCADCPCSDKIYVGFYRLDSLWLYASEPPDELIKDQPRFGLLMRGDAFRFHCTDDAKYRHEFGETIE